MAEQLDYYGLMRQFWDWAFENPEIVTPTHCAVYSFAVEHCNRLGWKEKFGLPSQMVMDAIGLKTWKSYIKVFNDLCEFGFFTLVQRSKNQYSSNIIAIDKKSKALSKALSKAMQKHYQKQSEYNKTNIQDTNIQGQPDKPAPRSKFIQPTKEQIEEYCLSANINIEIDEFMDHYIANGWVQSNRKPIVDWKAAVRQWKRRDKIFKRNDTNDSSNFFTDAEADKIVSAINSISDELWNEKKSDFTLDAGINAIYSPNRLKYVTWDMITQCERLRRHAEDLFKKRELSNKFNPAGYGKK